MPDLKEKILNFFKENPDPPDKKVHEFAESLGINEHRFEEQIYKILGAFASGGLSTKAKTNYNQKELEDGIKVEREHTTDPTTAARIAKDHLAEISDYYTRLDKLEEKAKEDGNFRKISVYINPKGKPKTILTDKKLTSSRMPKLNTVPNPAKEGRPSFDDQFPKIAQAKLQVIFKIAFLKTAFNPMGSLTTEIAKRAPQLLSAGKRAHEAMQAVMGVMRKGKGITKTVVDAGKVVREAVGR